MHAHVPLLVTFEVMADPNACINVVACRFEAIFKQRMGRTFSLAMKEDWKCRSEGVVSFLTPTMQRGTLWNESILCEGYRPKMLLYALSLIHI